MAASVCLHLPSGALLHRSKTSSHVPCFLRSPKAHRSPRQDTTLYQAVGFGVGSDLLPVPFADSPPARKALFRTFFSSDLSVGRVDGSVPDPGKGLRLEEGVITDRDIEFCSRKGEMWTIVILGWLGAEKKHLKKYAVFYKARGIRPVLFVVPLVEAFGLDFGRRIEERIAMLASELAVWCSERESDGTERRLLFHTFSNFGWLVYGSILMNLQSRGDVVVKIKGCIVDSGPAPEINPKIWAAGFCAALIKKNSSASISHGLANGDTSNSGGNKGGSKLDWKSSLLEITTKFILEKFFTLFLFLPIIKRKLGAVISVLSKNQPSCPQLYLYSSADRVIPASLVESFIEEQKSMGRAVLSYDFLTSPHIDHFRCFRRRYSAEVDGFLDGCCSESFCRESVSL